MKWQELDKYPQYMGEVKGQDSPEVNQGTREETGPELRSLPFLKQTGCELKEA